MKADYVIPHYAAFERATPMGALAQIIQASVDVGIADLISDRLLFRCNTISQNT